MPRALLQYWVPEQVMRLVTGDRRTRVNAAHLWCGEVARGGTVSVGELLEASKYAANVWWWLAVYPLGLGIALAVIFGGSIPSQNPVWALPFTLGGVFAVGLAQHPVLLYRALRARRGAALEDPVPARLLPRARDFWLACVLGIAVTMVAVLGHTGSDASGAALAEADTGAIRMAVAASSALAIVAGLVMAGWAARRRPPGWRRMSWREVARNPATREAVLVCGLVLLVAGGVGLGVLPLLK